tara:strand:- start:86 stop:340 length:255 start_codon:yes stop_codon:yes gene_type:complete
MASSRNNALEFSSVGSIVVQPSDGAVAGTFGAIQFLKDSTVGQALATNVTNPNYLHTSFGAGTIIYGNFTSVALDAGLVQLHRV